MKRVRFFISVMMASAVMLVSVGKAMAQVNALPGKYAFVRKGKRVVIPFELHNNLIVIKTVINKSDTLNFVFDTGASANLVTDPEVSASLCLRFDYKISIVGYGGGKSMPAWVSTNNEICLPGIVASGQSLLAINEDVLDISSFVGMPVHGLLGYDLLKNFVVKIDYCHNRIVLYEPSRFKLKKKDGEKFKISIHRGKPYIKTQLVVDSGKQVEAKLMMDTGAGNGLLLDGVAGAPAKSNYKLLGSGLNGSVWGREGRLQEFRIGEYSFKNAIGAFPDSSNFHSNRYKAMGNVGGEMLKRFQLVFNYKEGYVAMKPNRKMAKVPFERDMSGLTIRAKGRRFNEFVVHGVDSGSPAYEAGVQEGDELYMVDGRNAFNLDLGQINEMLNKKEGKQVKMVLKRGEHIFSTKFKLKRTI